MKRMLIVMVMVVFLFTTGCAHKQKTSLCPHTKERLAIIHEILVVTGNTVDLLDDETIPVEKRMEMYESLMDALNKLLGTIKRQTN